MRTTLKDFLDRSYQVHGRKYDYSKVDYRTTESKVTIICPEHGEFLMRPRAHYQDRRGCPACDDGTKSGFSPNSKWAMERLKFFYVIEAFGHGERFLKVGLTVEDITSRFLKGQIPYDYRVIFSYRTKAGKEHEDFFIEKYNSAKYVPKLFFKGHTECIEYELKSSILTFARSYFKG